MASDHQLQVLLYLRKVESATKGEIYANVNFGYYHNWQKHFGDCLSRMVKQGLIFREKRGVYRIGSPQKQAIDQPPIGLFLNSINSKDHE